MVVVWCQLGRNLEQRLMVNDWSRKLSRCRAREFIPYLKTCLHASKFSVLVLPVINASWSYRPVQGMAPWLRAPACTSRSIVLAHDLAVNKSKGNVKVNEHNMYPSTLSSKFRRTADKSCGSRMSGMDIGLYLTSGSQLRQGSILYCLRNILV